MDIVFLRSGARFEIWAIAFPSATGGVECPARSFLDRLERDAPADFKAMVAVLKLHAEAGPLHNERKSKALGDGIQEFKTRNGSRILWFYEAGARTILTHGFGKGAPVAEEIRRAKRYRDTWKGE
jgi:hypothetical protein